MRGNMQKQLQGQLQFTAKLSMQKRSIAQRSSLFSQRLRGCKGEQYIDES